MIGIHFFDPVPVLPPVEPVPSLLTSEQTRARAQQFVVATLGRHAFPARDSAGFVVNALLIPYLLSAVRMAESGFATPEDIDAGTVLGCAHPMGPLPTLSRPVRAAPSVRPAPAVAPPRPACVRRCG